MSFGQWLREMRKGASMTQRELAVVLGIDHTYLSKIEASKMPPPGEETLRRIASVLSMDTDLVYRFAGRVPQAITLAFASGVTDDTYRSIMACMTLLEGKPS